MAEKLTLTTPITRSSITEWEMSALTLDRTAALVTATFLNGSTGETRTFSIVGAEAQALMSTLNTANLTNNSLQKRAMTWAQSKGFLGAGSIAGTPE